MFRVHESTSPLEVCARVINGQLERDAIVTMQTVELSNDQSQHAISNEDYIPRSVQLTFTPNMTAACLNVTVMNDSFYERNETFNVTLTTLDVGIIINPGLITITILDDEEIVIGWLDKTLQVDEFVGQAAICLSVQGFVLEPTIVANVTTRDGTASRGGRGFQQDYVPNPFPPMITVLPQDNRSYCINIPIVNDVTFDSAVNETFFVDLSLLNVDRVTISSSTVVVSITDDEGKH